MLRRRTEGVEV